MILQWKRKNSGEEEDGERERERRESTSPPPPTGAIIASKSGTCSKNSRATVPCPIGVKN
jgi:hypothetical protein